MTNYDSFLSRAAEQMKESAIRRMGTVLASGRDVISFAPGYPAPETFPWAEFRDITAELLNGSDGGVLQYGPTRGYRPLLDAIRAKGKSWGESNTVHKAEVAGPYPNEDRFAVRFTYDITNKPSGRRITMA